MRALVALLLVAGCHGRTLTVPEDHRAVATACVPSANPVSCNDTTMTGSSGCLHDSDCGAGMNGVCEGALPGGSCHCTYDGCSSDADCATGEVCACAQGLARNRCVPSTCQVDADCPVDESCKPSADPTCGHQLGIVAYACTTERDECHNDSDCPKFNSIYQAICELDSTTGHWACVDAGCAF